MWSVWFCLWALWMYEVSASLTGEPVMNDLEDDVRENCTMFQAQTDGPLYTKLRLNRSTSAVTSYYVAVSGLDCSKEGLYLTALTTEQTNSWFGRWSTCSLVTMVTRFDVNICNITCTCGNTCPQLQLMFYPKPGYGDSWQLCGLFSSSIVAADDCQALRDEGHTDSGVYYLLVRGQIVRVYCQMVLMRRVDGSVDFDLTWKEYKHGFGQLIQEFWLGNELMHQLTNSGKSYKVRLEGQTFSGDHLYLEYSGFSVGPETDNYRLAIGSFVTGNTDDAIGWHRDQQFTTRDRDNDQSTDANCAVKYTGGWWYKGCFSIKFTGHYGSDQNNQGNRFQASTSQLQSAAIKIIPE